MLTSSLFVCYFNFQLVVLFSNHRQLKANLAKTFDNY
nr:MAG TPA: hypothetical protein [Caudoviricetes sp.]